MDEGRTCIQTQRLRSTQLALLAILNVRTTRPTDYKGEPISITHGSFNSSRLMMVQLTLVLRHYVKHCRLTNKASIRVREAAGELAGVAAVALCLPRRGCTVPPGNSTVSSRRREGPKRLLERTSSPRNKVSPSLLAKDPVH